jgi:hypothetical protein
MPRIRSIAEARAHLKDKLDRSNPVEADPHYVWSYGDPDDANSSHAFLVRRYNITETRESMRIVYVVGPRGGVNSVVALANWQYDAIR